MLYAGRSRDRCSADDRDGGLNRIKEDYALSENTGRAFFHAFFVEKKTKEIFTRWKEKGILKWSAAVQR